MSIQEKATVLARGVLHDELVNLQIEIATLRQRLGTARAAAFREAAEIAEKLAAGRYLKGHVIAEQQTAFGREIVAELERRAGETKG